METTLTAANLQADIMGVGGEFIIVSRTDAEAADLIDSDVSPVDQRFIKGTSNQNLRALRIVLAEAQRSGATPEQVEKLEKDWLRDANLMTYKEAVIAHINQLTATEENKRGLINEWEDWNTKEEDQERDYFEAATAKVKEMGLDVNWDHIKPRTIEGYYRIQDGVPLAVARQRIFARHADMLWMETATPGFEQAKEFADGIHAKYPGKWLAYNTSPSFNWDKLGWTDQQIADFIPGLAKFGYVWTFNTYANWHMKGLGAYKLAIGFEKEGMLQFVRDIAREERKLKLDIASGNNAMGNDFLDFVSRVATGGTSSTLASGAKSTGHQFDVNPPSSDKAMIIQQTITAFRKGLLGVDAAFDRLIEAFRELTPARVMLMSAIIAIHPGVSFAGILDQVETGKITPEAGLVQLQRAGLTKQEGKFVIGTGFLPQTDVLDLRTLINRAQSRAMVFNTRSASGPISQTAPWERGGIDLNTSNGMQWKVSKDGKGVEMNVDSAMIARIQREGIDWLSPVIFKMTPVSSVWPLMGLQAPS
jgi:hypothetical protein